MDSIKTFGILCDLRCRGMVSWFLAYLILLLLLLLSWQMLSVLGVLFKPLAFTPNYQDWMFSCVRMRNWLPCLVYFIHCMGSMLKKYMIEEIILFYLSALLLLYISMLHICTCVCVCVWQADICICKTFLMYNIKPYESDLWHGCKIGENNLERRTCKGQVIVFRYSGCFFFSVLRAVE